MKQPGIATARFRLIASLWALFVLPAIVSSQSAGQGGSTQGTVVTGRPAIERMEILIQGRGQMPRRIADWVMTVPAGNPITDEKTALGRRLFFDKQLSLDRTVSCATCHDPERAFADGRPVAIGLQGRTGRRNSPTLVNRGFGRLHFWDGRAATLEIQALGPIADEVEMALPLDALLERLQADKSYGETFEKIFERPVAIDDVGRALASYLRTIKSVDSPYDKFIDGAADALSADAQAGLQVFRARGRCAICHREPTFTDEAFYNTGISWRPSEADPAGTFMDNGRFDVTSNPRDRGAFKVPTLREVARTAPYMHDGSLKTLREVVDFYDKGGRPNPSMIRLIQPLNLSEEEKRVLVVFLESLSGVVSGK
jgi:cytochrome c peroxidase